MSTLQTIYVLTRQETRKTLKKEMPGAREWQHNVGILLSCVLAKASAETQEGLNVPLA